MDDERRRKLKRKTTNKTRTSARRATPTGAERGTDNKKTAKDSVREDDGCSMQHVGEDRGILLRCVSLSLSSLFRDLFVNFPKMPGDTSAERLYNVLTINDRIIYLSMTLLSLIIMLLLLKILLGGGDGQQQRAAPHQHFYYPPPNRNYASR